MENLILIGVILVILGLAGGYVFSQRKRGVKCIGCPDAKTCGGNCSSCPGCQK